VLGAKPSLSQGPKSYKPFQQPRGAGDPPRSYKANLSATGQKNNSRPLHTEPRAMVATARKEVRNLYSTNNEYNPSNNGGKDYYATNPNPNTSKKSRIPTYPIALSYPPGALGRPYDGSPIVDVRLHGGTPKNQTLEHSADNGKGLPTRERKNSKKVPVSYRDLDYMGRKM
jgi:hypothetical protein